MGEHPHPAYPDLVARLESIAASVAEPRDRAIDSVAAVMSFFSGIGMERRLYGPLLDLAGALVDAREGRKNPLLTPAKYKGGSKKLVREQYDLVAAAAAVTMFKDDAGHTLSEAAAEVEKLTGIDAKELVEFRKNIGKGRVGDQQAIEDYAFFLRKTRESPLPAKERIRRSLSVVAEMRVNKKG